MHMLKILLTGFTDELNVGTEEEEGSGMMLRVWAE